MKVKSGLFLVIFLFLGMAVFGMEQEGKEVNSIKKEEMKVEKKKLPPLPVEITIEVLPEVPKGKLKKYWLDMIIKQLKEKKKEIKEKMKELKEEKVKQKLKEKKCKERLGKEVKEKLKEKLKAKPEEEKIKIEKEKLDKEKIKDKIKEKKEKVKDIKSRIKEVEGLK